MLDLRDRAGHSRLPAFNEAAAERLREAATLLSYQGDNPYRVAAYRRAGDAVAAQTADLRALLEAGGIETLEEIPGVGRRIAGGLAELARTGRWTYLERLRGSVEPHDVFCTIPGVGPIAPNACTRRSTWRRSSNWKRLCTRRAQTMSRESVRDDWQSCAPRWRKCWRASAPSARDPPTSPQSTCCSTSTVNTAQRQRQTS